MNVTMSIQQKINHLKSKFQEFKEMEVEQQRSIFGEILFPMAQSICQNPANAPKVTGMLIDLEVFSTDEILKFLDQPEVRR